VKFVLDETGDTIETGPVDSGHPELLMLDAAQLFAEARRTMSVAIRQAVELENALTAAKLMLMRLSEVSHGYVKVSSGNPNAALVKLTDTLSINPEFIVSVGHVHPSVYHVAVRDVLGHTYFIRHYANETLQEGTARITALINAARSAPL